MRDMHVNIGLPRSAARDGGDFAAAVIVSSYRREG
jgi:hypothetical protein